MEKARLESCIERIKDAIGDSFTQPQMVDAVLLHNFNTEEAINDLLQNSQNTEPRNNVEKKLKGEY